MSAEAGYTEIFSDSSGESTAEVDDKGNVYSCHGEHLGRVPDTNNSVSDDAGMAIEDHEPEAEAAEPVGDHEDTGNHSKELSNAAKVLMKEAMAVHRAKGTQHTLTILKLLAKAGDAIKREEQQDAEAAYRERLQAINQECAKSISELTAQHTSGHLSNEGLIKGIEDIQSLRAVDEKAAAKALEESTQHELPDYQGVIDHMKCPVSLEHGPDLICACKHNHAFARGTILELWRTSMGIPTCPLCRVHMNQVKPTKYWKVKNGKDRILYGLFPDNTAILFEKAGKKKLRAGSAQ